MSIVLRHQCPILSCTFHIHPVNADLFQTKNHLDTHSYKELLKTARDIKLIQEYARPNKIELVEYLAENSIIRRNQDG